MAFYMLLLLLILVVTVPGPSGAQNGTTTTRAFTTTTRITTSTSPPVDDLKSPADILALFGYPHEQHNVLTEDGYILQVDRIPNPGRPPVFLAHPILGTGAVYLNLGRDFAIAFNLFDAGFDVWLGNVRGSAYSTGHVRLTTDDPEYWMYSFHEHGVYDHPASIDMVLSKTGYAQVFYVGHSMGSTTFLIMNSVRPEYNAKIRAAFLMAPVSTMYNSKSTFKAVVGGLDRTAPLLNRLSVYAFPHPQIRKLTQTICRGEMRWICNRLYLRLNDAIVQEDYLGNTVYFTETFPGSGSLPTFWHVADLSAGPGVFRPYSSGAQKDLQLYGQTPPPNYPLEKITAPVYTYVGDQDTLTDPRDLDFLRRSVRSIVKEFRHPDPLFCHADFVFSKRSQIIYADIIKKMTEITGQIQQQ